jgi:hypothetical protein
MTGRVDVPAVTLGRLRIVEYHEPDTVTVECTAGGVHGQRLTVTREWLRDATPDGFEVEP